MTTTKDPKEFVERVANYMADSLLDRRAREKAMGTDLPAACEIITQQAAELDQLATLKAAVREFEMEYSHSIDRSDFKRIIISRGLTDSIFKLFRLAAKDPTT